METYQVLINSVRRGITRILVLPGSQEIQAETETCDRLMLRPIADLSLSVRTRKCMIRLGITTIGKLVEHTGDDLLECKYFGITSLIEIRDKLAAKYNLRLAGE